MASEDDSRATDPTRPAPPTGRAGATERALRVDAWQRLKRSFAFALAAQDHEAGWLDRFAKTTSRVRELTSQDADTALYVMLQTATDDVKGYSASHALFCDVVADLCATHLEWPEAEADAIRNAALTMNLGMLATQDALALQAGRLSPAQKLVVEDHPEESVGLLQKAGVSDILWLEIVRRHHRPVDAGQSADPLTPPQRLAQLLQRIDVFTAKLSKRKTRQARPLPSRRATLPGRLGLPTPQGAMLPVLGLYPPGSCQHINGETAVVIGVAQGHTTGLSVRRGDGSLLSRTDPCARPAALRMRSDARCWRTSPDAARPRARRQRVAMTTPAASTPSGFLRLLAQSTSMEASCVWGFRWKPAACIAPTRGAPAWAPHLEAVDLPLGRVNCERGRADIGLLPAMTAIVPARVPVIACTAGRGGEAPGAKVDTIIFTSRGPKRHAAARTRRARVDRQRACLDPQGRGASRRPRFRDLPDGSGPRARVPRWPQRPIAEPGSVVTAATGIAGHGSRRRRVEVGGRARAF
jgi:hypothetical protein